MVGAIKGCTGVEPTIVGKPSPLMIDYIIQKYGAERCGPGCSLVASACFALVSCVLAARQAECYMYKVSPRCSS